jgi:hypothetical protein
MDSQSRPVVVGATFSDQFPTTSGSYDPVYNGACDAMIARLKADGTALDWSTYLGGSSSEWGFVIALDAQENPVVAGITDSNNFPTTPGAFDSTLSGGAGPDYDCFVTKLSAEGDALLFSTFLGGNKDDRPGGIVYDNAGNVVLAGATESGAFPTTPGAFDESKTPFTYAAFVTKLAAAGDALVWSTFVEGSLNDAAHELVMDDAGNVVIAGLTASADFPTTEGAYDETHNGSGDYDMFVTKVAEAGNALVWSTFLGDQGQDSAVSVALDPAGNPIVYGATSSEEFPVTANAYDETYNGNQDAVILKLDAAGENLLWSTYFGGSDIDVWEAVNGGFGTVVVDATGSPVFAATTASPDLPLAWADTLGPFDASYNGGWDQFIARLSPDGGSLTWSTYCGGSGNDYVLRNCLALDHALTSGVLVGYCFSDDFPTSDGVFQETYQGPGDGIAARFTPPDATGVNPWARTITHVMLQPCYPNPFREGTTIRYDLPRTIDATLTIHDVLGRIVQVLDSGRREAGPHRVTWNGRTGTGARATAGVYYCRLKAGDHQEARSVLLLR